MPPATYDERQWAFIEALSALLPIALAQLDLTFRRRGAVDFVALNLAAIQALGEPEAPTDLALALDYRIQHLLIDEFQDTSLSQFELLLRLTAGWQSGDGRTVFAGGRPDAVDLSLPRGGSRAVPARVACRARQRAARAAGAVGELPRAGWPGGLGERRLRPSAAAARGPGERRGAVCRVRGPGARAAWRGGRRPCAGAGRSRARGAVRARHHSTCPDGACAGQRRRARARPQPPGRDRAAPEGRGVALPRDRDRAAGRPSRGAGPLRADPSAVASCGPRGMAVGAARALVRPHACGPGEAGGRGPHRRAVDTPGRSGSSVHAERGWRPAARARGDRAAAGTRPPRPRLAAQARRRRVAAPWRPGVCRG